MTKTSDTMKGTGAPVDAATSRRRMLALGSGVVASAAASVLTPMRNAHAAPAKLRLAHATSTDSPQNQAAMYMAERVKELSKGEVELTVFPGSTLGTDQQMINLARGGSLDICLSGSANFNGVLPMTAVLELPFLFRDADHAYKVLDGPIGQGLLDDLNDKGLKGLSYFENGWRVLSNNRRPVRTAQDVKGLKVRSTTNPYHIQAFQLLGMNPSPLAVSELYAALETHSFDAQEHPLPVFWTSKFYEVQKYLSMTNHAYSPIMSVMNRKKFDALSPMQKQAIQQAALDGARRHREINTRDIATMVGELKKRPNFEVVEALDMAPFKEVVDAPVRKSFGEKLGTKVLGQIDAA